MKREALYKVYQIILFLIYIGLMVFFAVKCIETGVESQASSQKVVDTTAVVINQVAGEGTVDPLDSSFQNFVRKFIGHYGFFVLLGIVSILFHLSFNDKYNDYILVSVSYGVGITYAVLSEFWLEGSTNGRGASWKDVGIDTLGFMTVSFIIVLIYYLIKLKKQKVIKKNAD